MTVTKLIDIVAGARPNFMKIAPIIRALDERMIAGGPLSYRLVHTGQHYDPNMSGEFFEQLGIPAPHVNLEVGSGSHAEQTGAIMTRYEKLAKSQRSDLCLVVGDVTSTMACAIVAQKLCIPVAHVEAGIRSGDWTMPEEINRIVTDSITNYFFTTSVAAGRNLQKAAVTGERIFFVGNTMIDTLLANLDKLRAPSFWNDFRLSERNYFVLTLHRPANVDKPENLARLLEAIGESARGLPVIFPIHPRTAKNVARLDVLPANLKMVEPQAYLEFNFLVRQAKAVVTDSGGITEETTVMNVPCMTLRDSTERPETVEIGTNELLGVDPAAIAPAMERIFAGAWKKGQIPEKWDGATGKRIVAALEILLAPAA